MKVLKKLSLAAAISAAAISAQAEMTAIDDALMGDITGQAGVTIEMSVDLDITKVTYTDTDNGDATDGSIGINTVSIGGALNGTNDDTTGGLSQTQTIDVNTAGDLVIGVTPGAGGAFALTVGSVALQAGSAGTVSNLVENVYVEGVLGNSTITVHNGTDAAYTAATETAASGIVIDMSSSIQITDAGADIKLGTGTIGLSGITFNNGAATPGAATMTQAIYANATGLVIETGSISGDLTIGSIELGGTSIGSVTVSGISMAGSTTTIYGH